MRDKKGQDIQYRDMERKIGVEKNSPNKKRHLLIYLNNYLKSMTHLKICSCRN